MGSGRGKQRRVQSLRYENSENTYVQHKQVRAMLPSGEAVEVDEDILPLLQELWSRGISTCASCQGEARRAFQRGKKAYISFRGMGSANQFLSLLLGKESVVHEEVSRELKDVSVKNPLRGTRVRRHLRWSCHAHVAPEKRKYRESAHDSVVFRFPSEQLAQVLRSVARAPRAANITDEDATLLEHFQVKWRETLQEQRHQIDEMLGRGEIAVAQDDALVYWGPLSA